MMVKPRLAPLFSVIRTVGIARDVGSQGRRVKLICFDFEANRNVSAGLPGSGGQSGRFSGQNGGRLESPNPFCGRK
jgi:hypothetical protein